MCPDKTCSTAIAIFQNDSIARVRLQMFLFVFVAAGAAVFVVVLTVPSIFRNNSEPESSNRVKLGAAQKVTKSVDRRIDVKTEERATRKFLFDYRIS